MAFSLKKLGKSIWEEVNPFDGKGRYDLNKPVVRKPANKPLLRPQVPSVGRQSNVSSIYSSPQQRGDVSNPILQKPTVRTPEEEQARLDPIRAKQRAQIEALTNRYKAGEITKEQRLAAADAVLTNTDEDRVEAEKIGRPDGIRENAVAAGLNISRGNPISSLQKAGKFADTLTNDTFLAPVGDLTNFVARKPAQISNLLTGRDIDSEFAKIEGSFADTSKMDSRIAKETGEFLGMAGQSANFALGPTAPAAIAGTIGETGQQNYDELIAQGVDKNEAKLRATVSGTVQAAIERYSSKLQVKLGLEKMVAGSIAKGLALEGGTEGLEEVTQKITDNVATNKPWYEGLGEAAIGGIKGGLMLGGAFGTVNKYGGEPVNRAEQFRKANEQLFGKDNNQSGTIQPPGADKGNKKSDSKKAPQETSTETNLDRYDRAIEAAIDAKNKDAVDSLEYSRETAIQSGADIDNKYLDEYAPAQVQAESTVMPVKSTDITSASRGRNGESGYYSVFTGDGQDRVITDYDSKAKAVQAYNQAIKEGKTRARIDTYNGDGDFMQTLALEDLEAAKTPEKAPVEAGKVKDVTKQTRDRGTTKKDVQKGQEAKSPVEGKPKVTRKKTERKANIPDRTVKAAKKVVNAKTDTKPADTKKKPKVARKNTTKTKAVHRKVSAKEKAKARPKDLGPTDVNEAERLVGFSETDIDSTKGKKRGAYQAFIDRKAEAQAKRMQRGMNSKNTAVRIASETARGVTSREHGITQQIKKDIGRLHGGVEYARVLAKKVSSTANATIGNSPKSAQKVWATMDPELAEAAGIKVPSKLTAREQRYKEYLTGVSNYINDTAYDIGMISKKAWKENKGGKYLARQYSIFDENTKQNDNIGVGSDLKQELGGAMERQDLSKIDQDVLDTAVTDPGYLVALRLSEVMKNAQVVEFANAISDNSKLVSTTDKKGYKQMPTGKAWGKLSGKYVQKAVHEDLMGFQYSNTAVNALYRGVSWYNSLAIRRGRKKLLTTMNPATRVINRASNSLIFAPLGGINPVTHARNVIRAKGHIENQTETYRKLVRENVVGTDLTQQDISAQKARLTALTEDLNLPRKARRKAQKAINKIDHTYGKADDEAKVAAYLVYTKRGHSHQDAVKMVKSHYQNYRTVAAIYDISSKVPVFGNAFARFTGDYARLVSTGTVRHPLRTATMLATVKGITEVMSMLSGEDEEDKEEREGRAYARTIPGTNISTEVNIGGYAIDFSKFLGAYALSEPDDQKLTDSKFLNDLIEMAPFESPVRRSKSDDNKGELEFNKQGWASDPLISPIVQLILDEDFKQDSVSGNEEKYEGYAGQDPDANRNRASHVTWQYAGPLISALENIRRAHKGVETTYKTKALTPKEAWSRLTGARLKEGFDPQENRDIEESFKRKDDISQEVKKLNPAGQEAWKRLTGFHKSREQVPNDFDPGTTRDKKAAVYNFSEDKWSDYKNNPGTYELMLQKQYRENKEMVNDSGVHKPINPVFNKELSAEFRKQLVSNRSQIPGEDVEANFRMYESSEWDKYQELQDQYKKDSKAYYPKSDDEFEDELVKHQNAEFPKKGDAKKAYDDAYKAFAAGNGPKPEYTDAVGEQADAYSEAKREWTNKERKARGLAPIPKEVWDNVTFGYQSDEEKVWNELKYGKGFGGGYGGYGGGGGGGRNAGSAYKYAIDLNAGGSIAKPKVSVKSAGKAKARSTTGIKKPTVTLKKSKV